MYDGKIPQKIFGIREEKKPQKIAHSMVEVSRWLLKAPPIRSDKK
jgi:hypothetical protein